MGATSLASCSEESSTPDADGGGDGTIEVPLAQVAKPKPKGRKSIVLRTSIRLRPMPSRMQSRMELSI